MFVTIQSSKIGPALKTEILADKFVQVDIQIHIRAVFQYLMKTINKANEMEKFFDFFDGRYRKFYIPLQSAIFLICSLSLLSRLFLYASQSVIGYLATPLSIAALATAGATQEISRGSTGLGII